MLALTAGSLQQHGRHVLSRTGGHSVDVDVFITFKPQAGQLLGTPQPIFEYLLARGGTIRANVS